MRLYGRAFGMRYDRHADHVRHAHYEKKRIFDLSSRLKEAAVGSSLSIPHPALPLQRQGTTRAAGPELVRLRCALVRCGGGEVGSGGSAGRCFSKFWK